MMPRRHLFRWSLIASVSAPIVALTTVSSSALDARSKLDEHGQDADLARTSMRCEEGDTLVMPMWMPDAGRRTAVTALTACLLLTACTDASVPTRTPTPQPTATATPTTSPTPTPTTDVTVAPQRPEAMATPSADGAAAAASYFISLFPYIFATGDLTAWDALSASDCQYCQNTRASVEDQLARGVRGAGSEIDVTSAAGTELSAGDTYAATVEITQAPSFEVSEDGTRRPDGEGGTFRLHLALWWRDGWIVRAVDATRV